MRFTVRIFLVVLFVAGLISYPVPPVQAAVENLVFNPGFELGSDFPNGWNTDYSGGPQPIYTWDSQAFVGTRSVKIDASEVTDARFIQEINVQPNTLYRVSGYIKTENVGHSPEPVDMGANLSLLGYWEHHTRPLLGTNNWTYVSFAFNSGEETRYTLACRLGFWSGMTNGTAWFDDLEIAPILPGDPAPSWKILVLIYPRLDFRFTGTDNIEHHYISQMTQERMEKAGISATRFVMQDIPALNSGYMVPTVTVQYVERTLNTLSPYFDTWWPSPADVKPELDPAFDSAIVIWEPWAVDQTTGMTVFITGAGGLTPDMSGGQTYNAIILDAAADYNHRNVFKHEWGHSITSLFNATGVSPKPSVNNHINDTDTQYVHCPTGEPYILVDETDDFLIPNSIYNNETGFTHDYYSGTTATPDQPTRCLGITQMSWATGGPASGPQRPVQPDLQGIPAVKALLEQANQDELISNAQFQRWSKKLDIAQRALDRNHQKQAIKALNSLIQQVQADLNKGRLDELTGQALIEAVKQAIQMLQ
jgi:hypothetical protein